MLDPVMGVDPGVSGGVAVLRGDGVVLYVQPFRPDMTEKELFGIIFMASMKARVCFFEKVQYIGPRPDQGKRGDGGQGSFTFGKINGLLRGMLLGLGVELRDVTPMTWQSYLGCLSGGNKNVTKRKAQELFPSVGNITHSTADALLIAQWGRQRFGSTHKF